MLYSLDYNGAVKSVFFLLTCFSFKASLFYLME